MDHLFGIFLMASIIISYRMMNFTIHYPPYSYCASPDEAALYFNSLCPTYDYQYVETSYQFYQPIPYQYAFYTQIPAACKSDTEAERSTADSEEAEEQSPPEVKTEEKQEATEHKEEPVIQDRQAQQIKLPSIQKNKNPKKEKLSGTSLKKNTEANLINNILSYVCSEMRSHKAVSKLLKTQDRKKIFYTFMNNLKKLNHKYVNRRNVEALLDLTPNQPHERVLARSVKRLQVLPITELRVILRRLVYDYLRNEISIVPILTSKKICRAALKEHFEKRRELLQYFFKGKEAL